MTEPPALPISSDAPRRSRRWRWGCLSGLILLLALYVLQQIALYNYFRRPVQTQTLAHGITAEVWAEKKGVGFIPVLGWVLEMQSGAEHWLVLRQNGQECYTEYFYPYASETNAPLAPLKLYQLDGKLVLVEDKPRGLDPSHTFYPRIPAPADVQPLPSR